MVKGICVCLFRGCLDDIFFLQTLFQSQLLCHGVDSLYNFLSWWRTELNMCLPGQPSLKMTHVLVTSQTCIQTGWQPSFFIFSLTQ